MSKKPEFSNKDSIQLFNDINIINQEDINNVKRWSALERKFNKTLREFGIEFELPLPIAINHPSHNNIFYLQTTRPTSGVKTSIKYEILYNQWKNKSDSDLKEQLKGDLSALCKAVEESGAPTRLPAPVYYADKLAGWIRDVKEFPPEEFKNKVFFA